MDTPAPIAWSAVPMKGRGSQPGRRDCIASFSELK